MDFNLNTRYYDGIFVFGSPIFPFETKKDEISSLPLELSWRIFTYLDHRSLNTATTVCTKWRMIIKSNKKLRIRLQKYNMAVDLGSDRLAKFYRKHKRRCRKESKKNEINYKETFRRKIEFTKKTINLKRNGETVAVCTKRRKIF